MVEFETIYDAQTEKYSVWAGKDDAPDYNILVDAYLKVKGGIRHLVRRYKTFKIEDVISDLQDAYFSSRPYQLGQACDGSIDTPVQALFHSFCLAKGLNPLELLRKAYPKEVRHGNYEEIKRFADWQGVEYPTQWGPYEFEAVQ